MAGKPLYDTGESKLETEQNRVFLTAIMAAEDGVLPLGTHLAAVCFLSPVQEVPANKPNIDRTCCSLAQLQSYSKLLTNLPEDTHSGL